MASDVTNLMLLESRANDVSKLKPFKYVASSIVRPLLAIEREVTLVDKNDGNEAVGVIFMIEFESNMREKMDGATKPCRASQWKTPGAPT